MTAMMKSFFLFYQILSRKSSIVLSVYVSVAAVFLL